MIHGAHAIIYSKNAEADRAFFRDVLNYRFADAGYGWLIFALPPAEIAFHPGDNNDVHELYLMCDDVNALISDMNAKGVATTPVHEERWGILTQIALPGGGKMGVYQPKHASPLDAAKKKRGAPKAAKKKAAPKKSATKPRAKAKPAKKAKKAKKRR